MSPRFQNKLLTVCVALLASMVLLGVAVVLEVIAPKGALGWLIKTVPLVVAIPAALVGYEAICDWYYKRFILRENQKLYEKLDLRETRYSDHGRWEPRIKGPACEQRNRHVFTQIRADLMSRQFCFQLATGKVPEAAAWRIRNRGLVNNHPH